MWHKPRGDRLALIGENEQLTYGALVERSYRYANWTLEQEIAAGDIVALMLPNCPDYVAIWLGITQAGCAVALINTSLVGDALVHAIRVAGAKHVIVAGALLALNAATRARIPLATHVWAHGGGGNKRPRIDRYVARGRGARIGALQVRVPSRRDRALLIYTSGTTGTPKAANVTHERILDWSFWFAGIMDAQPEDRLYSCLPMYHSIGGVVAIGSMLVHGGSVLIRPRFSVSLFWNDIHALRDR